ncbi:hypothetical protein ACFY2R_18520 [Micromonospora olivasterospora]|uniref:Deazaflavin-dependent oxidoreductase (Nitroreductase family) n=1 Tax=Micromonospora olivasterospora TaxID=1880 RepID=A0A562I2V3_MICOL|nr:hypothetical protein [Micromonospora olivasterospora]TWH65330.1 hypothetical protein JD77_00266 [Micromonospora olivasterospora]
MADSDVRPARRHRHAHRPPAVVNRLILAVLRSRRLHGLLDGQLCEVRYRAADGRAVSLPVLYAVAGERYVVLVGDASDKCWWRHFRRPAEVQVCRGGRCRTGLGRVVPRGDPAFGPAAQAYARRHRVLVGPDDQLLVLDLPAAAST